MSKHISELPYKLIEEAVVFYEGRVANSCRINIVEAQFCGEAAMVMGFELLEHRIRNLLKNTSVKDFLRGSITSISIKDMRDRSVTLSPKRDAEENYPRFETADLPTSLPKDAEYALQVTLEGDRITYVSKAWRNLGNISDKDKAEKIKEEIILIAAVLGELDFAADKIWSIDFQKRGYGVLMILAIEFHKMGRTKEALQFIKDLQKYENCGVYWYKIMLALGLSGRIPFIGYPWPDY